MALQTTYSTGTATINAGETVVTGVGTGWLNFDLRPGDLFWAAGLSVRIASVDSNTQLTLAYPWPGASRNAQNYEARVTPDVTRVLASARAVLDALTNGVLYAFSGLVGAADRLPYFTGAGTAALATFTAHGRSLVAAANAAAARTVLQLAAIASSGSASDLIVGTIPDGVLPGRLRINGAATSDANTITETGWYRLPGVSANIPIAAPGYICHLQYDANAGRQIWYRYNTSQVFERSIINGVYGVWAQLLGQTADLNPLYAQVAGPTTDVSQSLGGATRRFLNLFSRSVTAGGDAETVPIIAVNGAAGTNRDIIFRTASVTKWGFRVNANAESGGNAGSNLEIQRRADDGSLLGNALTINRATGIALFEMPPRLPSYTVATLPAASAFSQCLAYVSNGNASKRLATSDGTNWRFPDGAIVS